MKSTKLSEMSDRALLKNEKTLKLLTYGLIIALTVMSIMTVALNFKKGISATKVTPIALAPIIFFSIVIVNLNSLKKMKKEIALRKLR